MVRTGSLGLSLLLEMMKKLHVPVVPILALACLMSACATFDGDAVRTSNTRYSQTSPSTVSILFESPSERYEVVGRVEAVAEFASEQKLYEELKRQAGTLGGDAVVVE